MARLIGPWANGPEGSQRLIEEVGRRLVERGKVVSFKYKVRFKAGAECKPNVNLLNFGLNKINGLRQPPPSPLFYKAKGERRAGKILP
ncbi:MAG: hypothetical protein Q8J64_00225 [Thermodesulfovibrionales bacterium]|nr:hypothetical protein [Thermodesulfovibrionales bacterium]